MYTKSIVNVNYASTINIVGINNGLSIINNNPLSVLTIDGFNPNTGDLILLKNQNNNVDNGIYKVINNTNGYLLNRFCMNVENIYLVYVKSGNSNQSTLWCVNLNDEPYTPGVTSQIFTEVLISGNSVGITQCTLGDSADADYNTLLEAFQDNCRLIRVIDSFNDSSIISSADVPDNVMLYIDAGIRYSYSGTIEVGDKNLLITGFGLKSELLINSTNTIFISSNNNTSLQINNIKLILSNIFDDTLLNPLYSQLILNSLQIEHLNTTSINALLVPSDDPSVLNIYNVTFIGNSSNLVIINDNGITDPNVSIRDINLSGTFSTSLILNNACIELTSNRTYLSNMYAKTNCSIRGGGILNNISSNGSIVFVEIVTNDTILSDSKLISMTDLSVDECNISNIINNGTLTINGNNNRLSLLDNSGNININGNENQLTSILSNTIFMNGNNNTCDCIRIQGSSSDLNVGGNGNIVNAAIVSDRTTINGTDCCVSGLSSIDSVIISGQNKLSNCRALDGLSISGFPAPTVSNCKVTGTTTIGASRASVVDIITDSISITGVENSISGLNVQSGGSFSISGIRNSVSGGASTPTVNIFGDQCVVNGYYFFSGANVSGDYCSLSTCRITSGSLIISGSNNTIAGINVTSGVTISGSLISVNGLEMNISGSLTITGNSCRINGSNLRATTIDVSTGIDCILTGNTISSLTINNGGGGISTDPLLIGNRLPGIPLDIAPNSTGNQV